jgi:hypothetical protein
MLPDNPVLVGRAVVLLLNRKHIAEVSKKPDTEVVAGRTARLAAESTNKIRLHGTTNERLEIFLRLMPSRQIMRTVVDPAFTPDFSLSDVENTAGRLDRWGRPSRHGHSLLAIAERQRYECLGLSGCS